MFIFLFYTLLSVVIQIVFDDSAEILKKVAGNLEAMSVIVFHTTI